MERHEADVIARAVNVLRPEWVVESLATLIWKHCSHHRREVVTIACTLIALDLSQKTPGAIGRAGSWWANANIALGGSATAATVGTKCTTHPDAYEPCKSCAAETRPAAPGELATALRAQLAAKR